jgi:peptide/nickel transport system permease protein
VQRFFARRLLFSVAAVFVATLVLFGLSHLGADPRNLYIPEGGYGVTQEQLDIQARKLGFDKPFFVQYFLWVGRMARGDFGTSLGQFKPVMTILAAKWGATLQLAVGAWILIIGAGVPIGVLAAVKRGSLLDYIARGIALFGQALPSFWVGIMLIVLFSVNLGWLPAGTRPQQFDMRYYILPCLTLGWPSLAGIVRLTRSSMLEILDSEYIKFARAKGVREWVVIWKHALKNSVIVPLTSALLFLAFFVTGSFITEIVFAWPGVGYVALYRAVFDNDFPLLMGAIMFYVVAYVGMAIVADTLYALIDPRIRYD